VIKGKRKAASIKRAEISERMRKVRSRDTGAEVALRKELWRRGARYRVAVPKLPGKPDLVFGPARLAVFMDGDYWHGNQWRRRGLARLEDQFKRTPSIDYWLKKIRRNMTRDLSHTAALLDDGWRVARLWESEVEHDLAGSADLVMDALSGEARADAVASMLPQKTFAEFFAGIGLMRMGLEAKGWSAAFANDLDPNKHAMFREHFGEKAGDYLVEDIHSLSADDVPTVSMATASFPCNDLSLAGARRGLAGKQSSAFWGLVRLLDEMGERRPPLVLLENVAGFVNSRQGADFNDALKALNRLGYAVDAFMLDARWFTPQSRKRLFVVAALESLGLAGDDDAAGGGHALRPKSLSEFIARQGRLEWRLRRLPDPPEQDLTLKDVIDDTPADAPEWWDRDRADYLVSQMKGKHGETVKRMIGAKSWSYACAFRRMRKGASTAELRTDGLAGCLRTPRGGSARQILVKAGRGECHVRLLTPRECARLMGAGNYRIGKSSNTAALFGFGDAVCAPAISWIARYYLNPLINEAVRGRLLFGG